MFDKLVEWIVNKLFLQLNKKSDYLVHFVIAAVVIMPVIIIGGYSIWREYEDMTDLAYSKKETIVGLSSRTVKERLDHMVNIGRSVATRPLVQLHLKNGNMEELSLVLDGVPKEFSFIDRIFVTDTAGVSLVVAPDSPETIGKDFSFRDWYQGVTKDWKPYVSEVYKRSTIPQYNVVAVVIPVKDNAGEVIGILGMQIKLDTFAEWAKEIGAEFECVIYFVDKNGKVIGHTQESLQGDIIDLSGRPAVQSVLKGGSGTDVYFDSQANEDILVGYKSVPEYGVGIVVENSAKKSFSFRTEHLSEASIFYGIILILNSLLAYLILKIIHELNYYRNKEKIFHESIGDGVAAIDRNWNIVMWNKAMASLSGYNEQEVMGKPFREFVKLIRKSDRKEDISFIEEVMLYGKTIQIGENIFLIAKDKTEIPVVDTAAPIFDENNVSGVIIVIRNVTKEKEAQMIKSDFAYASHQLRTPVNKALWDLETVVNGKSAKKIKELAVMAYKSLQSMQKLVNELVEVSAIDQNMVIPYKGQVRMKYFFRDLKKYVELRVKEKEINLVMPLISVSTSIETDQKLLLKAIYEIIENAILYSQDKSDINIELTMNGGSIVIIVSDSGIGIPEDQQALIFTKFFRGRNIDTTNIVGGGLGLYIAQKYINLLGGKIWFGSGENKGTKVFVSLPTK